jgi:chromosome segregation ATPase
VAELQKRVNELAASAQEAQTALRAAEQKVADADNRAAEAEARWMEAEDGLDKALGVTSEADGLDQQLKQVRARGGARGRGAGGARAGKPARMPRLPTSVPA